jgi:hypothetical protein
MESDLHLDVHHGYIFWQLHLCLLHRDSSIRLCDLGFSRTVEAEPDDTAYTDRRDQVILSAGGDPRRVLMHHLDGHGDRGEFSPSS